MSQLRVAIAQDHPVFLDPAATTERIIDRLDDREAAVRYWAATGIGNIGTQATSAEGDIVPLLRDSVAISSL